MKVYPFVTGVVAALLICQAASAQNALGDPSFNFGTASWYRTLEGGAQQAGGWDPSDAGGSNLSGSALTVAAGGGNGAGSYLNQCVQVSGSGQLRAGVRLYAPTGQNATGKAIFGFLIYKEAGCKTSLYNGSRTINLGATDGWIDVETNGPATGMPDDAWVKVFVGVSRTSGESLHAYWDDAYLTRVNGCRANNRWLCVDGNQFEVQVRAKDPRTGNTAEGVVAKQKGVFGFFSLPGLTNDAGNPEVFLKVLDGRPINGKYWVFYSGLTDLELTIDVQNLTGLGSRRYTKAGLVLESVADTSAF